MIKKFLRNIILREKASSERFLKYLNKRGIETGKGCYIPEPSSVLIDTTAPWLISFGDNVTLTHGVIVLTHDYGWSVIKKSGAFKGAVLGSQAPVKIGNNVFVGVNAVITKGVTIGDNVIIGAGSVVTNDCESNSVYVGTPAKKIMTIEEYTLKRRQKQFEEAKKMALVYREKFKKEPPMDIFKEYFMLFCSADEAVGTPMFKDKMEKCQNFDDSVAFMRQNPPMFDGYDAFLKACFE